MKYSKSKTVKHIYECGYSGAKSTVYDFLKKIEEEYGKKFEIHPHIRTKTEKLGHRTGSLGSDCDYITRNGTFRYLWMNGPLDKEHQQYIFAQYPLLTEIQECICEFQKIFEMKHIPLLHTFINKYKDSKIREIRSFTRSLNRDINAIENAVYSTLSNGFVEGTNNKLKTIKRTMYGRCSIQLLAAKMMLSI